MPITQAARTFASQNTVPQLIGLNFVAPFSSLERRKRFFSICARMVRNATSAKVVVTAQTCKDLSSTSTCLFAAAPCIW